MFVNFPFVLRKTFTNKVVQPACLPSPTMVTMVTACSCSGQSISPGGCGPTSNRAAIGRSPLHRPGSRPLTPLNVVNRQRATGIVTVTLCCAIGHEVGPPLSDKLFPVHRVAQKTATRSGGNLFYFVYHFFIN